MLDREYEEIPSDAETDEEISQPEQESAPIVHTQPIIPSLASENRYKRENEKPIVRVLTTKNNQNSYILFDPKIYTADTPNELITVRQFNDNEKEAHSSQRAQILVLEQREDNNGGLFIFYDPTKHFGTAAKLVTHKEFSGNFNRFKKIQAVVVNGKWVEFDSSNVKHLQLTVTEIYNCQLSKRVKIHQLAKSSLNQSTSRLPGEDERDQPSMSDESKKRSRDENSENEIEGPDEKRKKAIELTTDNNPIEVKSAPITPIDIEISNLKLAIANKTQELHDLQNQSKSVETKFNNITTMLDSDDDDDDLDDQALQNIMQSLDDYKSGAIENKIKLCQEELESLQNELASKISRRSNQIHSPGLFNKQTKTKQLKESSTEKDNERINKIKLAIDILKREKQALVEELAPSLKETINMNVELINKDPRSFISTISQSENFKKLMGSQRAKAIEEEITQKEKELQILTNTLNKLESKSLIHTVR